MNLSEREFKILEAIINSYVKLGEPIASNYLVKNHDFGVSSATIRNDMSVLKKLGLITNEHSSSGRIPADKGYRLYVDQILSIVEKNTSQMKILEEVIKANCLQLDTLMKETVKAVSDLTNYTTFITKPISEKVKIKQVKLIFIDTFKILVVVISNNDNVENKMLFIKNGITLEFVDILNVDINNIFKNKTINTVDKEKLLYLKTKYRDEFETIVLIVESIISIIKKDDKIEFFTSGMNNMLSYTKFKDINEAKEFLKSLEERELLKKLLDGVKDDGIQVVIGSENNIRQMEELTFVKSSYCINDGAYGNIGIIGPTRMDYRQVILAIESVVENINKALNNNE